MIDKIKEALRHNQGIAVAVVLCLALGLYLVGCESSVTSPVNPPKKVTRPQLDAEKEHMLTEFKLAYEDLAKQDVFKQKLFEIGLVAAQGGSVNPIGAGVTLLGILGLGAVVDNKRKDSVIKTLQSERKPNETV